MDGGYNPPRTVNPNKPSEIRRQRRLERERATLKEERKSVPRSPGPLSRKKQRKLQKKQEFEDMIISPDENGEKKLTLQADFDKQTIPVWANEINDYKKQVALYVTHEEQERPRGYSNLESHKVFDKRTRQQKYYIHTLVPNKADTPAEFERKKEKLLKLIAWMGDMNARDITFYKYILDYDFFTVLTDLVKKFDLTDDEIKSVLPKGKDYHPLMNLRMSNNNSISVYMPARIGNIITTYLYGEHKPEENLGWRTIAVDEPKVPPHDHQDKPREPEPEPMNHVVHASPIRPTSKRLSPAKSPRQSPRLSKALERNEEGIRLHETKLLESIPPKQYPSSGNKYKFTHNSPRRSPLPNSPRQSPRIPNIQGQAPNGRTEDGYLLHAKGLLNAKSTDHSLQAKQTKKPWSIFNVFTRKATDKPKKKGWFGGRTRRSTRR